MKNNKKNIGTKNSKFLGPFVAGGGDVVTVVIVVIGLVVCHQKRWWWSCVRVVLVMK